ncbi:Cyclin-dependent kinase G-1 [Beauveria bassiana D1-5]|uniref:cyclin-dependent kinase n=1 Tax=Beauveria bassiana D1-5 TaxID=1245745 RepID=A0A0A2VCH9_BEABA|nr:Cyclin-dependent kinase G-1 [Beauveria bassiana D1-5]
MSTAGKSRWADTEEDAELESRIRQEKEEKRRRKAEKAEKARRLEGERQAAAAASRDNDEQRPSKRRKLTPEQTAKEGQGTLAGDQSPPAKLLRFETGSWGRSSSVEDYDKLNDIEEGTYGWVARATRRATGKVVALKRLKLDPADRSGLPVTGLREIQILHDCKHRNVVTLEEVVVGSDVHRMDNSIFLVLEFVEHDIKSILDDMPEPFLASEIKCLLQQLTVGVAYLHENWILHRDLKTSNLLLNNRGQLKIADFGMARYVGDPAPKLTQLVVTLWYRAPELLLGAKAYDTAVDMWSVGCIFGELIAREPLLQGANEADQVTKIFELCGVPTEESWPGFRKLPNARSLRFPKTAAVTGSLIRAKFPSMTSAGAALLTELLALDPDARPSAKQMLQHEYFRQDPKPKPESMFPTFPSKAGQERRRRHEPNAPVRGQQAASLGDVDLSGILQGRDQEERGGGFSLRMRPPIVPHQYFVCPISPPPPVKPLNLAYTPTPASPPLELDLTGSAPVAARTASSTTKSERLEDSIGIVSELRLSEGQRRAHDTTRPQTRKYSPLPHEENQIQISHTIMSYFKTGQEWLDQSTLLIQASPTTTKITTRYSIKAVKRRKPSTANVAPAPAEKPPRAELVLKTFDPRSGVTLKYRTTKAAEVSRLMGAAMGQLGRSMAALPEAPPEESMPDAAAAAEEEQQKQPQQTQQPQAQSTPAPAGGGGGGKKKKKGKK